MSRIIIVSFLISLLGCVDRTSKKHASSKYNTDLKQYSLRQSVKSPINGEFIAIYYDESRSLSGIKLLKLYSSDSTSIDELYYGAHPMEISNWTDSTIVLDACVFSAHGDSLYRKLYLDGSVDKNKKIGIYNLSYNKNYNCIIK